MTGNTENADALSDGVEVLCSESTICSETTIVSNFEETDNPSPVVSNTETLTPI